MRGLEVLLGLLLQVYITETIPSITLIPSTCGSVQAASGGKIIRSVDVVDGNYTDPVNCSITMTSTSPEYKIKFGFNTGYGEVGIIHNPNGTACEGASVQLFDGPTTSSASLTGRFCGDLTSEERLSSGNTLTMLVLSTGGNDTVLNFTAHYTSFKTGDCGSEFQCSNDRCISPEMKCDTTLINNCGDFSDNSAGPPANCTNEPTTAATTVTQRTVNGTGEAATDTSGLIYIAYGAAAAAGLYFLHWLFFRPGWLVWRMGCVRHLRCCRNCGRGGSAKNSVDTAKPLTSSMDDIASSKSSNKITSDTTTFSSTSDTRHTRITSGNTQALGIWKEQHVFSLP